mgnify:CR=1 FL=1
MAVEFEQRGPFAVVKINRPEARNAVNPAVAQGIEDAVEKRSVLYGPLIVFHYMMQQPHQFNRVFPFNLGQGPNGAANDRCAQAAGYPFNMQIAKCYA